ncbi:MAG TPA: spore germination protein [Bacillota bacterium]|nr:spore germination protein [Bacillota bacterium]
MKYFDPNAVKIETDSRLFLNEIGLRLGNPYDLHAESFLEAKVTVIYLHSIINKNEIQDHLLAALSSPPLVEKSLRIITWNDLLPVISERDCQQRTDMDKALQDLVSGRVIIHLYGNDSIYSFDAHTTAKRQPTDAQAERSIRAPRITFIETLDDNLSLIRSGIKDINLRVEKVVIGTRSQTDVAILYLNDVASPRIVQEVHQRLNAFEIDGILDSGYIEQLISDNRWSIFPLAQNTERPDKVKSAILEGRVALLVDGSPQAVIVPATINDLYQSPEDYYFGFWFGSFLRAFRILGNNIAVALPGLYVALVGVNNSLLPIQFTLSVAGSRLGVALPFIIEILIIEIIVEVFREASLRLPSPISQTLGVTVGIVLGTAAVQAGIVSSATLVVVVVTAIASFTGPNFSIGFSWRILKYGLLFAAAIFGLFGLIMAGLVVLAHAAMQNSFGVPFLSPWSPVRFNALIDTVTRRPLWAPKRLQIYQSIEKQRFRTKRKQNDEE